jgi:hypothetical protein
LSQALARRPRDEATSEEQKRDRERDQGQRPYVEPRVYYRLRGISFRYGSFRSEPLYNVVMRPREYFIEVPRLRRVMEVVEGLGLYFITAGDRDMRSGSKVIYGSDDLDKVVKAVDEVVRIIEESMGEKMVYVVFDDLRLSTDKKHIYSNAFEYYAPSDLAYFRNSPWIEPIGYAYLPPWRVVYAYASIFNPYVIDKREDYIALPYTEEVVERVAELLGEFHMKPDSEVGRLRRELEELRSTAQRRPEEQRGDLVKVKMVLYRLPSEAIRGISSKVASELRSIRKELNETLHRSGYRVFDIWVLRSDVDPAEFARSVVNEINSRIEYLRKWEGLKTEPGDHVILVDAWLPREVLVSELKRHLEERREVLRDISQREQEATGARRRNLAHERARLEEEVRKLEEELKRLERGEQ